MRNSSDKWYWLGQCPFDRAGCRCRICPLPPTDPHPRSKQDVLVMHRTHPLEWWIHKQLLDQRMWPSVSSTPAGSSHTQGKHQNTTGPCALTWQGEPTGAAFLLRLHEVGQCQNWSQCFLLHTWGQAGKKSDQLVYTCSHSFITLGVGRLKECKWLLVVWFSLPTTLKNKKKTKIQTKKKKKERK